MSYETFYLNQKNSEKLGDSAIQEQERQLAEDRDRRRYPRHECLTSALVEVQTWKGQKKFDGVIHEASVKGLRLQLDDRLILNLGDSITVQWKMPPPFADAGQKVTSLGHIVHARTNAKLPNIYGIRFDHLLEDQVKHSEARYQKIAVALTALLIGVGIFALKIRNLEWFWYSPFFQAYSVIVGLYILSKIIISLFYKEPKDNGFLPRVTVVVAAKNEEFHIEETIEHLFAARYPEDKMEVLVVDDGSTDETWKVLQQIAPRFPRLSLYQFDTNKGKRHAMALGAEKAKGDILIFVDSDSMIEPEGIYKLVQPFADATVGAVAGHCLVEIEDDNIISKMEAVRYYVSHRVMKAAESVFGAVSCCPGPFSAYRKAVVLGFLPQWQFQKFMGMEATFGDDRSLTNFVLRTHRTLFHHGAIVRTYVPNTWMKFFRQQLRWKKSWGRETIIASSFMWRQHALAALPYYMGVVLTLLSPIVALHALVYLPIVMSISSTSYLAGLALLNVLLSCIYYYFTRSRYWYYSLVFSALYVVVLCWQTYYAILTMNKTHWGTR